MVLNFFQLRNFTANTFQIRNTENSNNDYTVAPYGTTARGDMWLAQGNGSQGVSISTFSEESTTIRQFLFMWDQDWAVRYRVGGQVDQHSISVNGNKDFSIDVYDTYFTFVCFGGTFDGSNSQVTVNDWRAIVETASAEAPKGIGEQSS